MNSLCVYFSNPNHRLTQDTIIELGGVELIIVLMRRFPEVLELQYRACFALINLTIKRNSKQHSRILPKHITQINQNQQLRTTLFLLFSRSEGKNPAAGWHTSDSRLYAALPCLDGAAAVRLCCSSKSCLELRYGLLRFASLCFHWFVFFSVTYP